MGSADPTSVKSIGLNIMETTNKCKITGCTFYVSSRTFHFSANQLPDQNKYVEIKCQLDATEVFIADLIPCSTCFVHHYAHHQELKSIIQWLLRVVFCAVVNQHPANRTHNPQLHTRPASWKNHSTKYHRQQPLYNTLELLMMGIVVHETCWASNKFCNKNLCCI